MAIPVLNSISPASGPPGTEITLTGSGFDAGAEVGCPALVATTYVSAESLTAEIPADLAGPATGGSFIISVFVRNENGAASGVQLFTVRFGYPESRLQAYTTVDDVAKQVPMFQRGGEISDDTIETWIRQVAQQINAALLGRGISLKPADWPEVDPDTAMASPSAVLELANSLGAANRLAAAVSANFGGQEWPLTRTLRDGFEAELKAIRTGAYDRLFKTSAATVETGAQFAGGGMDVNEDGEPDRAFTKGQVF